jgi:hypothetical protein
MPLKRNTVKVSILQGMRRWSKQNEEKNSTTVDTITHRYSNSRRRFLDIRLASLICTCKSIISKAFCFIQYKYNFTHHFLVNGFLLFPSFCCHHWHTLWYKQLQLKQGWRNKECFTDKHIRKLTSAIKGTKYRFSKSTFIWSLSWETPSMMTIRSAVLKYPLQRREVILIFVRMSSSISQASNPS